MWNPKGRIGHVAFPPPTVHLQVLGCWPVDTEAGKTRDSAGQSSGAISGDGSDSRLVLQGGDGGTGKRAEDAEVQVEKEEVICNLG